MYVNHIVLLTKQISVLTREIKLENMNRRKGFPSVLAHLFILVFKLVLLFFPDWHFSKSSCSLMKVYPSRCSTSMAVPLFTPMAG